MRLSSTTTAARDSKLQPLIQLAVAGAQQAPRLAEMLDHRTLLGYRLSYFFNSLIGPIGASLGYSNKTRKADFYINLGFQF